ncbi:antibiotic biosynthesis monooxygenase family protein [Undibacterium sp. TS12]|uniref:antibiotic biosynthesis monooxygenase family protein n=1 Tax=Undibacterium sp. TS12 TaxID=2908202 RepID=UPI001F4C8906|nr:antibiotic biosynthesis monooxygenase family protein [Undibacterium sp. TS12]MCH8621058.1 antibiotic biosynthesis monooxygenase [Undibacterium sp. TS12]
MITEYLRYQLQNQSACAEFEQAYLQAMAILRRSPHCLGAELSQCLDAPTDYIVRITWDSVAGHLEGFRKSADFMPFLALVRPYIPSMPEMRHYQLKMASEQINPA